jgi:tRNA pseudouridine13 synthase
MTKFGCERAVMSIPHQSRVMFAHSFTSLLWNHLASYRIQEYGIRPVVGDFVMSDAAKNISERVRPMTSSDISSGRYSIHNVVIPLPGSEVTLPTNSVGTKLMEMLAGIGLTLLSFKVHPRNRKFVIPGSYRRLVGVVRDVQWKMVPPSLMSQATPISSSSATPMESCDLEMEFKLDSGCYATVVLDEFSELNLTYY